MQEANLSSRNEAIALHSLVGTRASRPHQPPPVPTASPRPSGPPRLAPGLNCQGIWHMATPDPWANEVHGPEEGMVRRVILSVPPDVPPLRAVVGAYIDFVLALFGGHKTHAAESLGISRETLRCHLRRLGREAPRDRGDIEIVIVDNSASGNDSTIARGFS